MFGDLRGSVTLASFTAGLLGSGQDDKRMVRNLYAGIASLSGFWTTGMDAPVSAELGNYGAAALMSAASIYMDKARKNARDISSENSQTQEPLEILIR